MVHAWAAPFLLLSYLPCRSCWGTCPPPAIIFLAEWGGPGYYFSGIERNLPDTKVRKKQDSYHAARASELSQSSAKNWHLQMLPPVWCSLLSQQCVWATRTQPWEVRHCRRQIHVLLPSPTLHYWGLMTGIQCFKPLAFKPRSSKVHKIELFSFFIHKEKIIHFGFFY